MTPFRLVPADSVAPQVLHAAFAAAFSDYLAGPFHLPLPQWPQFLARQGVHLAHSRVAMVDGAVQAFALAAPRPPLRSWRLGTMGAPPQARGGGAARLLLVDFGARAHQAGCTRLELECFARNERALRLYRRHGFAEAGALHGWRRPAKPLRALQGGVPASIPLQDAFAFIEAVSGRRGDVPFQVTPASLQAQPVALQAWRSGKAQLVAAANAPSQLTVYSLLDEEPEQRGAEHLMRHLLLSFPAHAVHVPQLQRDDLGGAALQRLGFERLPLHQVLMHKRL
jgi:GNAT superfamily N-acetyltransferase